MGVTRDKQTSEATAGPMEALQSRQGQEIEELTKEKVAGPREQQSEDVSKRSL